jgi:hypothetical protein
MFRKRNKSKYNINTMQKMSSTVETSFKFQDEGLFSTLLAQSYMYQLTIIIFVRDVPVYHAKYIVTLLIFKYHDYEL